MDLAYTLDRLVNVVKILQAGDSSTDTPEENIQPIIKTFPVGFEVVKIQFDSRGDPSIAIHDVKMEFLDKTTCRIISFISAGTTYYTLQEAPTISITEFKVRSSTVEVTSVLDLSKSKYVDETNTVTKYTEAGEESKLSAIFTSKIYRSEGAFDDRDLELKTDGNRDIFVLNNNIRSWRKYLRSIVPADSPRFGYARDTKV